MYRPSLTVVVVVDATCQRPLDMAIVARELPACTQVIAAVLWPPPTPTLSVRLLAWRLRHRTLVTDDLVGSIRSAVRGANPGGDITVLGQGFSYPRGASPRGWRAATAIVQVCLLYRARFLVLSDQPHSIITAPVRNRLRRQLPQDIVLAVTDQLLARPPRSADDPSDH